MSEFVSFDNDILHLLNPLPPITVEELHKRANVTLRKRKTARKKVFDLELRWGGGEDLKTHTLKPGTSMRMQEKMAKEIVQDFKPVGGGLCATNPGLAYFSEDDQRLSASIEALLIAEAHYHICGAEQMDQVRNTFGHKDEEVERMRNSKYSTYFLAMAKEACIREKREKLEQELAAKETQAAADRERFEKNKKG